MGPIGIERAIGSLRDISERARTVLYESFVISHTSTRVEFVGSSLHYKINSNQSIAQILVMIRHHANYQTLDMADFPKVLPSHTNIRLLPDLKISHEGSLQYINAFISNEFVA